VRQASRMAGSRFMEDWLCEVPIYLQPVELPGSADELAAISCAGVARCTTADPDQPAHGPA
jgi:hypothetical protein